jgi:hypothetical protein
VEEHRDEDSISYQFLKLLVVILQSEKSKHQQFVTQEQEEETQETDHVQKRYNLVVGKSNKHN